MSRNDRNILILGSAAILLAVIVFYLLLLGPLLGTLGARAEERSEKEARLDDLRQEVAELEAVRRNAPEIERQLLEYNKRIPTQPEIETLTVQMEEIADEADVTWDRLDPGTPGPPPGGGDYSVQPITMSFEGTYAQLQDFLTKVDKLARLVAVEKVTFQPLREGTNAAPEVERVLSVEIEAEVYFQPTGVPQGEAPAAPDPPENNTQAPRERNEGEETGAR